MHLYFTYYFVNLLTKVMPVPVNSLKHFYFRGIPTKMERNSLQLTPAINLLVSSFQSKRVHSIHSFFITPLFNSSDNIDILWNSTQTWHQVQNRRTRSLNSEKKICKAQILFIRKNTINSKVSDLPLP